MMSINRTRALMTAMAALLAGFAFAAISAPQADAGVPPICEEYPDLPQCEGPGGGGGSDDPDGDGDEGPDGDEGAGPGAGAGPSGDAGGDLPFTGYPVTPLLMFALLLLLAALVVRSYAEIRKRLATNSRS